MSAVSSGDPRRDTAADVSVDPIEDIATPAAAKPRAKRKFGKSAIAASLASVMAVGALFAYAFTSRDTQQPSLDSVNAEAAVPAAAQEAAKLGFADRSADVSRNALREGISGIKADENARERSTALESAASDALASESKETAAERERLMDEDLKLVAAQAAKLKKEAEEAARRLEEARKAAEAAGMAAAGMSAEDVANLTAKGGSLPLKSNYRVGAGFGKRGVWARYHTGQDFPAPVGTPIYAVASGVVLSPTSAGWAGTNVVIQHGPGATLYAHMSRSVVRPGQTVKPGQLIGYVGNTGRSFGAHLHLEYYKNGTTPGDVYQASNPMTFLKSLGVN